MKDKKTKRRYRRLRITRPLSLNVYALPGDPYRVPRLPKGKKEDTTSEQNSRTGEGQA